METYIIGAIITIGIYFIFSNFFSEEQEDVQRRLVKIKEDKDADIKTKPKGYGDDDIYYDNTAGFLVKTLRRIARDIAEKSKNIVLQKQLLSEAGLASDDDAVLRHITKKIVFAGALMALSFLIFVADASTDNMLLKIFMLLSSPMVGFRFPDFMLRSKAKTRSEEVTYALPDAIDLLTICVEAGLGLDSAIGRVAQEEENSSPILAFEFNRVTKDVLAGVSRADAFRNLVKRNASPELKSFTGLLIQSDRLGTSIAQALKVYSDVLRTKRRQRAEQLAAQAGVKMSIPLVLFILPATFIIILGPAAIGLIGTFMGGTP